MVPIGSRLDVYCNVKHGPEQDVLLRVSQAGRKFQALPKAVSPAGFPDALGGMPCH